MRKMSVKDRIKKEVNQEIDEDKIIVFKIVPESSGCCCSHCWRLTWDSINRTLDLNHTITHEDGALVKIDNAELILEDHESGPEIIVWIQLGTSLIHLISSIISIILLVVKSRQNEKPISSFYLKKIKYTKGKPAEEIVMMIPQKCNINEIKKLLEDKIKL